MSATATYEPQTLTEAIRYYSDELTCIGHFFLLITVVKDTYALRPQ